ncbi:hypothetical protein PF010_g32769 [Phytophthora fragariae]|uniref:Uncharacterized protein n=1 Tax=Phytophthora fragariae TaxID=53985 RepID=A0A6A3DFL3_9STRA|nr:hypothetical protein PF003_g34859 [Phytophthora fragariae]KAE8920654.1 hypothetical protein PF009_g29056 [Phytophthora fragariae]KAE9053820.1 hypothetical protein PF010_g32769 [Phytophthora fragariae]KAE9054407.1 hypothetical protein PF007_g32648 [Phytophthora fragariae]KAE9158247.1 hypothetical protein PF002_g33159 [Phytophthora fragariae]
MISRAIRILAESNAGQISLLVLLAPRSVAVLGVMMSRTMEMLAESNAGQISLHVLLYIGVY